MGAMGKRRRKFLAGDAHFFGLGWYWSVAAAGGGFGNGLEAIRRGVNQCGGRRCFVECAGGRGAKSTEHWSHCAQSHMTQSHTHVGKLAAFCAFWLKGGMNGGGWGGDGGWWGWK